jgi:recombination protein RecA
VAAGVNLAQLLWIRCGVPPVLPSPTPPANGFALPEKYLVPPAVKKGLHGGGFGPHPRNEVKGISDAIGGLLRPEAAVPRCAEPQRKITAQPEASASNLPPPRLSSYKPTSNAKPWLRIEQALRTTDLLLQSGGFSAIVLDLGSVAPEYATRVPLATWFRYRAAAEKSQASILLLTQHACAKSSAGLVLRLQPGIALLEERTVFTGIEYSIELARERFKPVSTKVVPLRKPSRRVTEATWQSRVTWAGLR